MPVRVDRAVLNRAGRQRTLATSSRKALLAMSQLRRCVSGRQITFRKKPASAHISIETILHTSPTFAQAQQAMSIALNSNTGQTGRNSIAPSPSSTRRTGCPRTGLAWVGLQVQAVGGQTARGFVAGPTRNSGHLVSTLQPQARVARLNLVNGDVIVNVGACSDRQRNASVCVCGCVRV